MFGVVLWSDEDESKAVIWCEDHGDLAFYRQPEQGGHVALDPGDLVRFDLTMDRHLRFAHNPELVAEGYRPDLAETLAPPTLPVDIRPTEPTQRRSAQIIPFRPATNDVTRRINPIAALP